MRCLIFIRCSDQSHIDVVVVDKSSIFNCAQNVANHESVIFTKSLNLSLKAVKSSGLSDPATFFIIIVFKSSKRVLDSFA